MPKVSHPIKDEKGVNEFIIKINDCGQLEIDFNLVSNANT